MFIWFMHIKCSRKIFITQIERLRAIDSKPFDCPIEVLNKQSMMCTYIYIYKIHIIFITHIHTQYYSSLLMIKITKIFLNQY